MSLSTDLAKQFAKATNDSKDQVKPEVTHNGSIFRYNGKDYVRLDGSEVLTPISKTAAVKPGERVTVVIKNHTATVTGNISSPAARTGDVADVNKKVTELYSVVADKATIGELEAQVARIDTLTADNVAVKEKLTAAEADIDNLQADNATISGKLTAAEAAIDNLEATKIDAKVVETDYALIKDLDATNANVNSLSATYADFEKATADKLTANEASIKDLEANKLSATQADLKYANIDFSNINQAAVEKLFTDSGIIKDLIVSEGKITGELVGVTIKGDLIEGGTVIADKLVVKGENGLYYKLNTDGVTTETEQTEYNSLNGSVITAKSITATKISVDDLVAFGATIGGFHISDRAIYSGVKNSVQNTTRGIYFDKYGRLAVGDANNYIKYFMDDDSTWKLAISADELRFGTNNVSVKEAIDNITESVDNMQVNVQVGGRNLLVNTNTDKMSWRVNGGNGTITRTSDISRSLGTRYDKFTITKKSTTWAYIAIEDPDAMKEVIRVGGEFTLSFDVFCDATVTISDIGIQNGDGTNKVLDFGYFDTVGAEWTKIVLTGKVMSGVDYSAQVIFINLMPLGEESLIEFSNVKLEKGNKATDWTPALEDVESDAAAKANDALTNAKSYTDAQLKITSESITSTVSKTYQVKGDYATNAKVDNIQIGGRNLLAGTTSPVIHTGTGSTNQVTNLYNTSKYYRDITDFDGKTFTLSFDWETTATSGTFLAQLNGTPWWDMSKKITVSSSNKSGRSVFTFGSDSNLSAGNYNGIQLRSNNLTGTITVKNVMFEAGNKPSSWQPAPEDAQFGGRNYILNSVLQQAMLDTYDSGESGWACPIGAVNASIDSTVTHNGHNTLHKQCAYADADTWYESNYYFADKNCIQFTANETWTLSLWIYAKTIPAEPLLSSIRLFNGNWTWAKKVGEISIGDVVVTKVEKWTHIELTFNTPSSIPTYDRGYVMFATNQTADCYMTEFKLEKGNNATDWTPAIDDDGGAIGDVNAGLTDSINDLRDRINSTNETLNNVKNDQHDTALIVSENQTKISELVQQASGFTMNFTTINEAVTKVNNEFVTERDERYKYIKFIDGEIWLGKDTEEGEDDFKLVIRNNRISFLQNENEVAYLSNNQLFVTDIHVTNSLRIGKFIWTPRANGNLALRWIGES